MIGENAALGELVLEPTQFDFLPAVFDALRLRDELVDFFELEFDVGLASRERGPFEFALFNLALAVIHFSHSCSDGTSGIGHVAD